MSGVRIVVVTAVVAFAGAAAARADSPPVGPLPAGPKATLSTRAGELVAVALPKRSGGRVWHIARAFDGSIVKEVSEADVGSSVVLIFKALHPGTVRLAFALTRGETTKALDARTFEVRIR